jgi:hypothetical protein
MLPEQPDGLHDLLESPLAPLVLPVCVVKFLGPIQAQADKEAVLMKELTPLVIEKDAVGLERILNRSARLLMLLLKFHGASEEIEPHQGRLTSLPGDGYLGNLVRFKKLLDIGPVNIIRSSGNRCRDKASPFLRRNNSRSSDYRPSPLAWP